MRMPSPTTSRPTRAGTLTRTLVGGVLAGVLAGVLTGVLAGCSRGEAEPSPTVVFASPTAPTTSPSPTASPTPTPTLDASVKPERPAAMDEVSAAGAEAVAVYFLNLFAYVYASNDLSEWTLLSNTECMFCKSVSDHVEEQEAAGNRSIGGMVAISKVRSTAIDPGRWWSVDVELTQSPSSTLDGAGKVVEDFPEAKAYTMNLAIAHEFGQWSVHGLSYKQTS